VTNPKVTVYITNHNYGRFLRQAVESVFAQKFASWELIIIDDGSTDGSQEILREYENRPGLHLVLQQNRGLIVSSNIALRLARGEYIMRLDADDYLDENALVVLANVLDTHPEVGLVYPDYYHVSDAGEILSLERRSKLGSEVTLYTSPAHGAGTMIRKSCLAELGGYSEDTTCQDGYDLWLRLIERFGVYNVNLPLFYYRQHAGSLSSDRKRIVEARRKIDRRHAAQRAETARRRAVGIIPVRGQAHGEPAHALRPLAGVALIDYTVEAALQSGVFDGLLVVSEEDAVLDHVANRPGVTAVRRPLALARPNTSIVPTVRLALDHAGSAPPDAFMLLYVNSPLRTAAHIRNAMDVMQIFEADSVISVYEDVSTHYQHGETGLRPLFPRRALRLEKEALWVENGAIYLARVGGLDGDDYLGSRIAHTVMLKHESLQIDSEDDFRLAEYLINLRRDSKEMVGL
jgi:CMP-N-acetylneuraminic acid synthetase